MKTRFLQSLLLVVTLSVAVTLAACGGEEGCPGKVCTNCAASGDCDVTCTGDDVEYCGHFGYFEDNNLRCAFCAPPDFQP
ncbi:MAG: hypothetical protein D6806_17390 [Deltaproteobacteria bacterium]|nr:MAG: hypothetical protein D6806_17390 [Deltaproteobacteria bacterium]